MKKINYFFIILFVAFNVSCSDFLDLYPLDSPSNATFLSNQQEMEMGVISCYNPLWLTYWGLPFNLALDYATDIGYERNAYGLHTLAQGAATPNVDIVKNYWASFYDGIAYCNYFINNMENGKENVDPVIFNKLKSEARFLRAFYYSYLTELYGDVPLITEVLTVSSHESRTPKSQVVDFILNELTEIVEFLPKENNPVSGKVTQGAALSLKARIALYNEKWTEAIDASSKVINMEGEQYVIEDDFSKLFTLAGESSKEIIFSAQYLKPYMVHTSYRQLGSRTAGGYTNKKPAYQLQDAFECIDGLSIDKSPLYNPMEPYKNRDPRLGYTLAVPGSIFLGYQFETHGDSLTIWNYRNNTRVKNLEVTNAYGTWTGLCFRKYCNLEDAADPNNADTNPILIRYAEVLLTYAEAKVKAGQIDQSVLDAINKVRGRESVNMPRITTTNPQELFQIICRERKVEFAGEGLRLFDIRRWKMAENVLNEPLLGRMKKTYPQTPRMDEFGNSYYEESVIATPGESIDYKMRLVDERHFNSSRDYLWPIPETEMQANPNMTQNPNY